MYTMGQAIRKLREAGEPDGFLYSDEALFTQKIEKPLVAHFKPDYDPDYLLCCNYICHLAVFRRELFEQVGGCLLYTSHRADPDLSAQDPCSGADTAEI